MTTTIRSITTLNLNPDSIGTDIAAAIGCSMFDVVGLADSIDLFVDDEGLINGSPLNLPATVLAHLLGSRTVIFGTAIAVSVNNDGETIGLTDEQLARIQTALAQKPDDVTGHGRGPRWQPVSLPHHRQLAPQHLATTAGWPLRASR